VNIECDSKWVNKRVMSKNFSKVKVELAAFEDRFRPDSNLISLGIVTRFKVDVKFLEE